MGAGSPNPSGQLALKLALPGLPNTPTCQPPHSLRTRASPASSPGSGSRGKGGIPQLVLGHTISRPTAPELNDGVCGTWDQTKVNGSQKSHKLEMILCCSAYAHTRRSQDTHTPTHHCLHPRISHDRGTRGIFTRKTVGGGDPTPEEEKEQKEKRNTLLRPWGNLYSLWGHPIEPGDIPPSSVSRKRRREASSLPSRWSPSFLLPAASGDCGPEQTPQTPTN